jgi:hypothetical protein
MRVVIFPQSGYQRAEFFAFHHYSWSEPPPMTLELGQRSQNTTSSTFISLVPKIPSNTERVICDSISGQCEWKVCQHLSTTLMSIAKDIV